MKSHRLVLFAAAALALLPGASGAADAPKTDAPKKSGEELMKQLDLLFVQSSASGTFDGKRISLALEGPTLFFSDRPARLAGHMSTKTFLGNWKGGKDSFETNPPNATLSIMETDDTVNAVVELTDPRHEGATVSYAAKVIEGKVPAKFGASSLFIDGGAGGYIAAALGGGLLGGALIHANDNASYARQQQQEYQQQQMYQQSYYRPPPQPYQGQGYYYRTQPGPCQ